MDKCEDLKEYLAAYADGELEGELRERVRRHLDECERCRSECAELKKVAELYRGSAPPEVGAGDWAKVSAALEASMVEEPPGGERLRGRLEEKRAGWWWLFPATALAAAVILVALTFTLPWSPTPRATPAVQVVTIETDPNYEAMVRLPMNDDDFLVIDVVAVE